MRTIPAIYIDGKGNVEELPLNVCDIVDKCDICGGDFVAEMMLVKGHYLYYMAKTTDTHVCILKCRRKGGA